MYAFPVRHFLTPACTFALDLLDETPAEYPDQLMTNQ
jgi:hypothetical protein